MSSVINTTELWFQFSRAEIRDEPRFHLLKFIMFITLQGGIF